MTIEQQIYEAKQKLNWLIDGYYINCVLSFTKGKFHIPSEIIVKYYNVNMDYFRPYIKN